MMNQTKNAVDLFAMSLAEVSAWLHDARRPDAVVTESKKTVDDVSRTVDGWQSTGRVTAPEIDHAASKLAEMRRTMERYRGDDYRVEAATKALAMAEQDLKMLRKFVRG